MGVNHVSPIHPASGLVRLLLLSTYDFPVCLLWGCQSEDADSGEPAQVRAQVESFEEACVP